MRSYIAKMIDAGRDGVVRTVVASDATTAAIAQEQQRQRAPIRLSAEAKKKLMVTVQRSVANGAKRRQKAAQIKAVSAQLRLGLITKATHDRLLKKIEGL
jgi:hypothetical protein